MLCARFIDSFIHGIMEDYVVCFVIFGAIGHSLVLCLCSVLILSYIVLSSKRLILFINNKMTSVNFPL